MQPQEEVTNTEFFEAIQMLSQVVTNQVEQQRRARQEEIDTSRIQKFLRMNPPKLHWFNQYRGSKKLYGRVKEGV